MSDKQVIVETLYSSYKLKGFVREEEALHLMSDHKLSLQDIEIVTGQLLGLGVIFADDVVSEDEDDIDRTRTDYEAIFDEVLSISPGQIMLIEFIRCIHPPQWREWRILMPQAQAGNSYAKNRLFEMYLRVVVKLALNTYKIEAYELDDLIQEGIMGLLSAIQHYDGSKHGSFVSYIPWWVMQYMSRAIANKSRTIRLPVHVQESLKRLSNLTNEIKQKLDYEPSITELAEKTGATVTKIQEMQRYLQGPISLDEVKQEDIDGFISYDIADTESMSAFENVYESMLCACIEEACTDLKVRELSILKLRFGLDDGQERTLEEIGNIYHITRERVRQIEAKALRKLKHPAHYKLLKSYLTV
jgi:RNA polymerase primary sigma factor